MLEDNHGTMNGHQHVVNSPVFVSNDYREVLRGMIYVQFRHESVHTHHTHTHVEGYNPNLLGGKPCQPKRVLNSAEHC